ncbi:transcriptional regulator, XRE family [Epibacterium ulvae]|uniref:Transcriptional regulator, XRE family n=1 Tax=Epibacterium ulvae TaxID=1156985 RepID=A0A1G5PJ18_9RHOB|nr:helix-turn-helix transcriptional regulator [Epibacterium ulvae]SCZ49512.1 transcriptional regulator, XRE family [Epibacterium ulvae]
MTIILDTKAVPIGSGNLAQNNNAENSDTQLKAWIVSHIARSMESRGLSQTKAAEIMGLKQPDLSAVLNGKFSGYSAERLARCLSALGNEVKLVVTGAEGSQDSFALGAF